MNNRVLNGKEANGVPNGKVEEKANGQNGEKNPFADFSTALEDMNTSLTLAKGQIGSLTNSVNDLEQRIKELKETGATKEELEKLKEKLEELKRQIGITNIALDNYAKKGETELIKETLQLLGASIDDEFEKLEEKYATKEDLLRKEEKIAGDIKYVDKQFNDRLEAVDAVAETAINKQQETEEKVNSLDKTVNDLKKELVDAVGRIGVLEQATNNLGEKLTGLTQTVENTKNKIDEIERNMGDKIKDMENKLNAVLGLLNGIGANINATISNVMPPKKDDSNSGSEGA